MFDFGLKTRIVGNPVNIPPENYDRKIKI